MTPAPTAGQPYESEYDTSLSGAREWFAAYGLSRPRRGRLISGVTAGFARRFGINLLVARVAAVIGFVIIGPLVYVPLWILMPKDPVSS